MLIDYHTHTALTDGRGRPVEYARVALARGLAELGCADHAPLPGDRATDWTLRMAELETYVGWVRDAQREFPQLTIKLGLEVDYLPGCADWVRHLAGLYPWDYFLGSVHFIGEWPVDLAAQKWEDQDVEKRWRQYFDLWAQAARSGLYDSLAHPDLPKKFNYRPQTDFTPVFDAALGAVAECGLAIEVSSAGLRQPCREIYPAADFLKLARRHDIPVTLGSDAHHPQDVGADFDQAAALLRACGYTGVCRFSGRTRELVKF